MNFTIARCGHTVAAEGAPGSMARKACEDRTCGRARCRSGLPKKFTDAECDAYVFLADIQYEIGFVVSLINKSVLDGDGVRHASIIDLAKQHGWREAT